MALQPPLGPGNLSTRILTARRRMDLRRAIADVYKIRGCRGGDTARMVAGNEANRIPNGRRRLDEPGDHDRHTAADHAGQHRDDIGPHAPVRSRGKTRMEIFP